MLNKESTIKAIGLIEELDKKINKENTYKIRKMIILRPSEDFLHLGNLRDYFMFFAFEATKKEAKEFLSWNLNQYVKSEEYNMFFFVIENILRLRHELPYLPMEQISKKAFLRSFDDTKEIYELK